MIFQRVHYAFAEFRGGARRFGPPLNTPLLILERIMLEANVCATMLDPVTVRGRPICGGMGADLCSTLGDDKRGCLLCFRIKLT